MVSTPPDAVGTTKPVRQSDTSESSDDDQPTPAKKVKLDDPKSKFSYKRKYARVKYISFIYKFSTIASYFK